MASSTRSLSLFPFPPQGLRVISLMFCLLLGLVLAGCESEMSEFRKAQADGSSQALEAFVAKYPTSDLAPIAMGKLDDVHFDAAQKTATQEGWRDYLKKHPNGKHVSEANFALEKLVYDAADKAGTVEGFDAFLKEFPNSSFGSNARARIAALQAPPPTPAASPAASPAP